jgi:hypothetical protein
MLQGCNALYWWLTRKSWNGAPLSANFNWLCPGEFLHAGLSGIGHYNGRILSTASSVASGGNGFRGG